MITLKKLTYLSLAFGLTILFIFVCILSQFGTRINSSETFQGFFDWYIALLLMNIFNMIVTFIFLYFKSELVGQKGLKGKLGDKGEPGSSEKCFCKDESSNIGDAVGSEIDQINVTDDTHTHQITDGENTGTMIHRHENFTNYSGNIETFSNNRNFVSVAYGINTVSSTTTHYIYAVDSFGFIHKLQGTILSDLTHTEINSSNMSTPKRWSAITCSANGQKIYATVSGGSIWKSTNYGIKWTEINTTFTGGGGSMGTPRNWSAITCSDNGSNVYATVMGGKIYKSTDSGLTFTEINYVSHISINNITSTNMDTLHTTELDDKYNVYYLSKIANVEEALNSQQTLIDAASNAASAASADSAASVVTQNVLNTSTTIGAYPIKIKLNNGQLNNGQGEVIFHPGIKNYLNSRDDFTIIKWNGTDVFVNSEVIPVINITTDAIGKSPLDMKEAREWTAITCSNNGNIVYATEKNGKIYKGNYTDETWELINYRDGTTTLSSTPQITDSSTPAWFVRGSSVIYAAADSTSFKFYVTNSSSPEEVIKLLNNNLAIQQAVYESSASLVSIRNEVRKCGAYEISISSTSPFAIRFTVQNDKYIFPPGSRLNLIRWNSTVSTRFVDSQAKVTVPSDSTIDMNTDRNWSAITCSSDGSKVYATTNDITSDGRIYKLDTGVWTKEQVITGTPNKNWSAITTNANGQEVYATVKGENVHKYNGSGWSHVNSPKLNGKNFTSIDYIPTNKFVAVSSEGIYVYDATDAANPTVTEYLTNTHSHQVHDVLT